jgi:hypothetical protein
MKKLLIIISVFMVFSACSKLEDLNENTKDFTVVSGQSVYNGATRALCNQLNTPNVNNNNTLLYLQHWTTTTYLDEPRYDMVTRPIPANHQNVLYRNVLSNYKEAAKLLTERSIILDKISQAQRDNQLAIIEIMSVFTWSNIVETYGDMPYSEALDYTIPTPKYDDASTIYKDLITRMDAALAKMTPTVGGMPSGFDNIYGGTAAGTVNWMKFANAIKLRMGLMLADADGAYAKTVVEAAAPKVYVKGDKTSLTYLSASPNQNPYYTELVVSGRSDFVVANTLIDAMQPTTPVPAWSVLNLTVADPRLAIYATKTSADIFRGGTPGMPNAYGNFSHVNPAIVTATREIILMDYPETEFLLAEAAARGFSVPGTVESHYNSAIEASITYWGGKAADITAYMAQPAVAYATAVGDWKQKIGTQAWIAYWYRGMTAWTSFRRLDYPKLIAPALHEEGIDKVPVRYTYAVSEQTLNGANYTAAVAKIGTDHPLTKLFWDKY